MTTKTRFHFGDHTLIVGGRPKRHRGAYPRGTRCWTVIGQHEHRGRRPTAAQGVVGTIWPQLKVTGGSLSDCADVEVFLYGMAGMEVA